MPNRSAGAAPTQLLGEFTDDYSITYTISDRLWFLHPQFRFHILEWHPEDQFLIARNHADNPSEPGLYSRIDWVELPSGDYPWAFCLTAYQAESPGAARNTPAADRANPKTGCNGFPFSRMRTKT